MNIVLVKLECGDIFIAQLKEVVETKHTFVNPVMLMPTQDNRMQIVPYPIFIIKVITLVIDNDKILFTSPITADSNIELFNAYNAQFGSGLIVPGQGIQVD